MIRLVAAATLAVAMTTPASAQLSPERAALLEEMAHMCGTVTGAAELLKVATPGIEYGFLTFARNEGADDADLEILRFKFAMGKLKLIGYPEPTLSKREHYAPMIPEYADACREGFAND